MEEMISKEDLEKIKHIQGETRGTVIKGMLGYVREKKGEEGLEKVQELLHEIGIPVEYDTIKEVPFYPLEYEAAILLITEKILGFNDDDFREIGEGSARLSFVVRTFLKYFSSITLAAKDPFKMFNRYYRPGELRVVDIDEQERRAIVRITKDFMHYPTHCRTLEGFLAALVRMITKSENSRCREIKCPHKGDDCHEFLVKW